MSASELKGSTQLALTLGCATGGAGATLALASVVTGQAGDGWRTLFDSSIAAQAAGAAVAVVFVSIRMSTPIRLLVSLAAALVLGAALILLDTENSLSLAYLVSILAGVVLGGAAGWAVDVAVHMRWLPSAVAIGAVVGVALWQPLSNPLILYADKEPTQVISLQSVTVAFLIAAMTLAIGVNPQVRQALSPSPSSTRTSVGDRWALGLGVGVAATAVLIISWWSATIGDDDSVHEWYFGYLQVAIILVVAVILGGTGGAVLAAFGAWTASRAGDASWIPDHSAWLIVAGVTAIVGVVLGCRLGRPVVGVVVLGVCAATYLVYGSPLDDVYSFTVLFVAPGAIAYTAGALMQSKKAPAGGALAIALAGPAFWMLSPRAHFIAIGYVGSDRPESYDISGSYGAHTWSMAVEVAVPMLTAIVMCGVVMLWILRRNQADAPLS